MRDLHEIFKLPTARASAAGLIVFIHDENLVTERELLGRQLLCAGDVEVPHPAKHEK
jgi:hypothetical protein